VRLLRWLTRSLILLLIMLFSALAAMRLAIHGREVRVPDVKGMTVLQAQETANASGLIVSVEDKFYSSAVPSGKIISQVPGPSSRVRRGWRVRVAESLGLQRVTIPDLVGQTERAASLNLHRRGLDLGTVAGIELSNVPPEQVVAQIPAPNAADVTSPNVSILLAQPPSTPQFVMPNFVGRQLGEAKEKISRAGLQPASVSSSISKTNPATDAGSSAPVPSSPIQPIAAPNSGIIVSQAPPPGARVTPDTQIRLQVAH
jgi:beta-lactam-binding protein with PASTA domain